MQINLKVNCHKLFMSKHGRKQKKTWLWCALVLKLKPKACARGQRNTYQKDNFDWSRNNGDNTRANYCPWDNRRTDNILASSQSKNTKILQRIIWQNIKKLGEYIYTQLNIFFAGTFLATFSKRRGKIHSLREDRLRKIRSCHEFCPSLRKVNSIWSNYQRRRPFCNRFSLPNKLASKVKLRATSCWLSKRRAWRSFHFALTAWRGYTQLVWTATSQDQPAASHK